MEGSGFLPQTVSPNLAQLATIPSNRLSARPLTTYILKHDKKADSARPEAPAGIEWNLFFTCEHAKRKAREYPMPLVV
jgi:hypothetical protein